MLDVEIEVDNDAKLEELRREIGKKLLTINGVIDCDEVDEDLNNDEE